MRNRMFFRSVLFLVVVFGLAFNAAGLGKASSVSAVKDKSTELTGYTEYYERCYDLIKGTTAADWITPGLQQKANVRIDGQKMVLK